MGFKKIFRTFKLCGFSCYADYLKSDMWKRIRSSVLRRDKGKCQCCLKSARCVHHIDYKLATMIGNRMWSLISLCRECHEGIEFEGGMKLGDDCISLKRQNLDSRMISLRGINLSQWKSLSHTPAIAAETSIPATPYGRLHDSVMAGRPKKKRRPGPPPERVICERKIERRKKKASADAKRMAHRLDIREREQARDKKLNNWKAMSSWERAAYLNAASTPKGQTSQPS